MLDRRQALAAGALLPCLGFLSAEAPNTNFHGDGKTPTDERLGKLKDLNGYFPFTPPKTKEEWAERRERVIEQVLVANGLWPMPEKVELNPQVTGKLDKQTHTIENVAITSLPGHYVTGNLYRPNPKQHPGKRPAILFAHGHWDKGRFQVESEATAKAMVQRGEEPDIERARYFMQALPITLAKLGFIVFQYDMVGYADSTAIPHIKSSGVPNELGFADAEGELRLHSLMGLQTWNSVRSLDYLCSLPEVDADKIGITGASGGGTQTFILAAIDERIKASAPAVMVSTGMQGGCVCENCSLLRVNTGNIELAALFAPRPLALPSANDWTREIMTKGYPELKQLYKLLGAEQNLTARAWLKLPHNYGRPSREYVYDFFLRHLMGSSENIAEPHFTPTPVEQLAVFSAEHPRPKDEAKASALRKTMTKRDADALDKLPAEKRAVVLKKALRAMVNSEVPGEIFIHGGPLETKLRDLTMHRALLGRKTDGTAVPHAGVFGKKNDGKHTVIWLHPDGKKGLFSSEKLDPMVAALVEKGVAVVAPDLLGTGELAMPKGYPVSPVYAAFTLGYNRSLLAQQVHDVLTTVGFARMMGSKSVHLIGWGNMGLVATLAHILAGDAVSKLLAERTDFDFSSIKSTADPMLQPGALKYGGVSAFVELCDAKRCRFEKTADMKKLDGPKAVEFLID
jgi:dienelactone hydrolase/pimeloyl-ACP methyl ester carboxylesterase